MRRLSKQRRERIVMVYVLVTAGRLPTDLGELLAKMQERMGGEVSEAEVRKTFAWVLRWSRRQAVLFERRLRAAATIG